MSMSAVKRISSCILILTGLTPLLCSAAEDKPAPPPNYLHQASAGIQALQKWYSQGTGLYLTTGWWNSANAITVLVNYSRLADDAAYQPVLANTYIAAQKTSKGFLNDYNDDEGWWALAWIDAYDLTHDPRYLSMARDIFTDMAGGWDTTTCGGGIWWSKEKKYKNAIANELFLSVGAELANRTDEPRQRTTYISWAQKEWKWFRDSGMINQQHLVNDGLDSSTPSACKNNGQTTWSYNQGVILGGLIDLNKAMPDATLPFIAGQIANAALTHLTDDAGILHDTCEPKCGADGPQFKGIFVRNLMALDAAYPNEKFRTFVQGNADSIWRNAQNADHQFGLVWSGPFDLPDAARQSSALDALVAAAAMQQRRAHLGDALTSIRK
jgi:predicted alpha-1,6-mannanase (GH76 family)